MRDKISFEWSWELTENGNLTESDYQEKLDKLMQWTDPTTVDICLIRNVYNDADGLMDREYAYVKDGKLPMYFDGGNDKRVPAKFKTELAEYMASLKNKQA